ncbi:MAG: histidinol-phosphate transaminase [Deltaproteobacteria bacterium]|jgi:histidinol-phosphate aminotransferase|nr:histidinol-phosphate transaminase [Deltaproteobacteria bacterium]
MVDLKNKIIPGYINDLEPYVPGKIIEDVIKELKLKKAVKLASNENNLGPSPLALEAVQKALGSLNRYADADARNLKKALSQKTGQPIEGIMTLNGSSEFIYIICHTLIGPGLKAIMSRPSFTLYAKNSQATGAQILEIPLTKSFGHDLNRILDCADETVRLIFLDNPLNPTGAYLSPEELYEFLNRLPITTILVLDEAYIDFCRAPRPDYSRLMADNRVVILRTFSKIFGLAGLRCGYAMLDPILAEALNKVRQPFNLNSLSQLAVLAALNDEEHIKRTLKMSWDSIDFFNQLFPRFNMTVSPTQANFVMVEGRDDYPAEKMVSALLKQGVIIRSLDSFGLPSQARITAGPPEELNFLQEALEKVLVGL